ncbi:hypothetical protein ABR847_006935 [Enterobacter hormaechei]|uniref:hypothetical protein n=1 Tax=Enterobacter cloacae complex TaxID=354276 RepID=UPI001C03BFFA|nr:hypothetical protein [Enterobacter hormaechei]MBU0250300.1 hypothetical protein [Enterobacter hormaechei]
MKQKDTFVGNYVKVAVNKTTTVENPSYYDPGYIESGSIASFPQIGIKKAVNQIEDYREDFTNKLSGDVTIDDVNIGVYETDGEFVETLEEALLNKTLLRFRALYVVDEDEYSERSHAGLYHIFDAYVTKKAVSGGSNAPVVKTFTLSPEDKLTTGYTEFGRPLYLGEFGIGAGTEDVPGVGDFGDLSGNRWITVDADNTSNPFSQDTSSMAIQHPTGQGWELIGTSVGDSALRVRNKQFNPDGSIKQSKWIKVYTESEKPTTKEIGALSIEGGTITGSLTINNKLTVKEISATTATIKTLNTTVINSDSVKVKGAEVYSPSNKPKPIDINCVALGEILDAGEF